MLIHPKHRRLEALHPPAVPILLESIRTQPVLDIIGVAALAAGAAALVSIPDALVVTVSVAAVTVAARRLRRRRAAR